MSLYANSPTTRPSAAIQHTLTRHRDILKGKGHEKWVSVKDFDFNQRQYPEKKSEFQFIFLDYRNEYRKTKNNISAARAREDLLGSVKRDIDEYKGLIGGKQELYQREREHLLSSDRLADQAIEVARTGFTQTLYIFYLS